MFSCEFCYTQDVALPYVRTAVAASRNKANRALAFFEPWEIAACSICATLLIVWIYEFLFRHNESMHLVFVAW